MLPPDDLYARLELPVDASPEAIEIAWRALLKRHHPDVAGAHTDDAAKRINVAHDWLSDPGLRERYDRERHPARRRDIRSPDPGRRAPRGPHSGPPRPAPGRSAPVRSAPVRSAPVRSAPLRQRRPLDPAEALERHIARIGRLNRDELDRLALAESPPLAFVATIARFLSADRLAAVEAVERRVADVLPRSSRWDAPTRDAIVAYAHEIVLGPFLDEHLSEPFRERVRERLARGWEAAVDQPRYGPNTKAVEAALERLRDMPAGARAQVTVEAATAAAKVGLAAEPPWPGGLSPHDDDALRVSSALAQRDALAILGDPAPALARRSLARAMHGLVLRHAFKPGELDRLLGRWRDVLVDPASPCRPVARRRPTT
jgi:curved DNA-binding protein CbpA